jgi:hypothetical protein
MSDYDNPWTFEGTVFVDDHIGDYYGFVYMITNLTNLKKYIGRKYFYQVRKPPGKKRRVTKPSNWKVYYGSNEVLKNDIEKIGKEHFKRQILSLHKTKGDVNYTEVKEQFLHNVLEQDDYYNENINGKWHKPPDHIIEARRVAWGNAKFLG